MLQGMQPGLRQSNARTYLLILPIICWSPVGRLPRVSRTRTSGSSYLQGIFRPLGWEHGWMPDRRGTARSKMPVYGRWAKDEHVLRTHRKRAAMTLMHRLVLNRILGPTTRHGRRAGFAGKSEGWRRGAARPNEPAIASCVRAGRRSGVIV